MRKLIGLIMIMSATSMIGCGRGSEINGHNLSTAMRSVKMLKERMPSDLKHEFQMSFWTIRDAYKDEAAFLDQVDGKNPNEIIAQAQEIFEERKKQGFQEYEQYSSWQDMVEKFNEERLSQDRRMKTDPRDSKDERSQSVTYKL